jgi:hypothetical protein
MYLTAIQSPPRFQFESNSGSLWASQTNNCGPTCVTKIAQFYKDRYFGIEATRRLVTACCTPTSAFNQRDMLVKRGVPAAVVTISSIAELRQLVSGGTRPIVIGVLMSRVPSAVRGHPFTGWHAICVLATAYVGGPGFWVNDPNFSPAGGIRPDPMQGRRFYSEAVMKHAFIDNAPRWSVVPLAHKVTVAPPPAITPALAIDGDPNPMRYRSLVNQATGALPLKTIAKGKPVRKGARTTNALWTTVKADTPIRPFGYIEKEDLPTAERVYGDVYVCNWYQTNGEHVGYVKEVDLT